MLHGPNTDAEVNDMGWLGRLPVLVDTFPFSEPYEADLLLLKLEAESPIVSEWVVVESSTTFQGEPKGLHAAALFASDERFAPYRDQLVVLSSDPPLGPTDIDPRRDETAAAAEGRQRDLAMGRLLAHPDDTWVFCSDLDELLDGRSADRCRALKRRLDACDGVAEIPFIRYWYDFDNRYGPVGARPVVQVSWLRSTGHPVSWVRRAHRGAMAVPDASVVGFEYSSCLPVDLVMRKLDTQAHSGYSESDLRRGLLANHRPMSTTWGDRLERSNLNFFERVALTEVNSPQLVRERLDALRVGSVGTDYELQRRRLYPHLYRPWSPGVQRIRSLARDTLTVMRRVSAPFRYRWRRFHSSVPAEGPTRQA